MRRLRISRCAETDLEEIWIYSWRNWGEDQADLYLDELGEGIRLCGTEPERGKDRREVRDGYRSLRVRRHVVFYTFTSREVLVQRVLHTSMDPQLHLLDDVGE